MKLKLMSIFTILIFTFTLTGCFNNDKNNGEAQDKTQSSNFSIKYPDDLKEKFGDELSLEKKPERIVCMTAGPVETLYELGVKMLAIPDSIITDWSDKIDAKKLPFGMQDIDIEGILALKPDLVILSTHNKDKYGTILESNNIGTYYVKAGPMVLFDDIKREVKLFGDAFDKKDKTEEIMKKFDDTEKQMNNYKAENKATDMAILFGFPPSMTMTSTSYLGDIMHRLGYNNLSDTNELSKITQGNSSVLNMEKLVSVDPKLMIACSPGVKDADTLEKNFKQEFDKNKSMWGNIDAVKNNNVIYLGSNFAKSSGIKVLDDITKLIDKLKS